MLTLVPITYKNWRAVANLELAPSQRTFLPPNHESILEAQFFAGSKQVAIQANGDDNFIGYALYGKEAGTNGFRNFENFRLRVKHYCS